MHSCVDDLLMPAYMVHHYDYSFIAGKDDKNNEKVVRNRICLICVLLIALTDNETSN